jgi:hypothetical protein
MTPLRAAIIFPIRIVSGNEITRLPPAPQDTMLAAGLRIATLRP